MGRLLGLLCAVVAALFFGVQYVPVKKYEIFDGATFQLFMGSGILMVGFLVSVFFGELENGCDGLVVFGGVLWTISNNFVLPLVKLLGIGLGFSLYHFVNLMVGYLVGRFGLFGVPALEGTLWVCDCGCLLVLISFFIMILVEGDDGEIGGGSRELQPAEFQGVDATYRQQYRQWRLGDVRGASDPRILEDAASTIMGLAAAECTGRSYLSVGGFSVFGDPQGSFSQAQAAGGALPLRPMDGGRSPSASESVTSAAAAAAELGGRSQSEPSMPRSEPSAILQPLADDPNVPPARRAGRKLVGAGLALAAGGLSGVQSVPATLHNTKHPGESPTAVVMGQCMGIWVASVLIYLVYSTAAKLVGWSVPHSALRPAFWSGCFWAIGFTFMIAGISELGYSVGYTLDAVGPIVVSSLLSLIVFKEIKGTRQIALYTFGLTLQIIGVITMTAFSSQ